MDLLKVTDPMLFVITVVTLLDIILMVVFNHTEDRWQEITPRVLSMVMDLIIWEVLGIRLTRSLSVMFWIPSNRFIRLKLQLKIQVNQVYQVNQDTTFDTKTETETKSNTEYLSTKNKKTKKTKTLFQNN